MNYVEELKNMLVFGAPDDKNVEFLLHLFEGYRSWVSDRTICPHPKHSAAETAFKLGYDLADDDAGGVKFGGEAEELREAFQTFLDHGFPDDDSSMDPDEVHEVVQTILDNVDARDSLAYLSRRKDRLRHYHNWVHPTGMTVRNQDGVEVLHGDQFAAAFLSRGIGESEQDTHAFKDGTPISEVEAEMEAHARILLENSSVEYGWYSGKGTDSE